MKVNPIVNPLAGEHVVGVSPAMTPDIKTGWNRRLNLYTGRALGDAAFKTEQQVRAGRLATRGQAVSHGVVVGLEVGVEPPEGEPGGSTLEGFTYRIAPGLGLTAGGEDVVLSYPLRVALRDVPVYAPVKVLDRPRAVVVRRPVQPLRLETVNAGAVGRLDLSGRLERLEVTATPARPLVFTPALPQVTSPAPVSTGEDEGRLDVRRVGPTFGELADRGWPEELPQVGVLVLQPVVTEIVGQYDEEDPCEENPENYAFEDWQLADGFRLLFYAWPSEWQPLPPFGDRWRNSVAYAVFNAERRHDPDEPMPWEEVGVPIALVAFDASLRLQFVDRYSVVRAGGKPRRRTPLLGEAGNQFLWQARIQQLAEHLADESLEGVEPAALARQFRQLPPAGLLPAGAVELLTGEAAGRAESRVGRSPFFPGSYHVSAAPVPLEQLDVAVEASAALKPFDLATADQVQVLVPVPETLYEPNLLVYEKVDPAFAEALEEFKSRVDELLQRRKEVRRRASALALAATAKKPEFADPDPAADAPFTPAEEAYGVDLTKPAGSSVKTVTDLVDALTKSFPFLATANSGGVGKKALDKINEVGLEGFIDFLEELIERAEDRIDFGFLRVRTDIYRIRQLIADSVAATRLATSPTLAGIARGITAGATNEDIETYLKAAKSTKVTAQQQSRFETKPAPAGEPAPRGSEDGVAVRAKQPTGVAATSRTKEVEVERAAFDVGKAAATDDFSRMMVMSEVAASERQLRATAAFRQAPAKTTAEIVREASTGRVSGVLRPSAPSTFDVTEQKPLIGEALDFRTLSIAERLEDSKAAEARSFAVASRYQVISNLLDTNISLEGITISGVHRVEKDRTTQQERLVSTFVTFDNKLATDVNARSKFLQDLLDERHPPNGDEAAFFAAGVEVLDGTIAALRQIEGRLKNYKTALAMTRRALGVVGGFGDDARRRLAVIEGELEEARHDLAVARALLAEETERVRGVNERRDRVVAEHVRYLAFQRPRHADLNAESPSRALDPGFTEEPVPACLASDIEVPAELRSMVALLRDAPLRWLRLVRPLLDRFDRFEPIRRVVVESKSRAQLLAPTAREPETRPGRLEGAITRVYEAQRTVVTSHRLRTAELDLSLFAGASWQLSRDRAGEVLSLGDLIEAGHGRSDVARGAVRELDDIARVAACLYRKFGEVAPVIRLEWIELLSQYDEAVNLRNLSALPRWGQVEYLDRREAQTLVDWLYQRVDAREPEAVSIISDLVRVCLLVASHAPVKRIVTGHVPRATTVKKGGRVELAVDHTKVRVGMHVLMFDAADAVVARGVVEDLQAGQAAARVIQTSVESVNLEAKARVQFTDSASLGSTMQSLSSFKVSFAAAV